MIFSPQQEMAMKLIKLWFNEPGYRMPFVLNGYAGTGKTTIAKYLPELIGASDEDSVLYTAFTGKAAMQLRKKGCPKATTLHKLLYMPIEKDRTKLRELAIALRTRLVDDPLAEKPETKALKTLLFKERRHVNAPSWSASPDWDRLAKAKLIVVDESSMVDAKIAKDLHELKIPIIYCGDPFQLPPVKGTSPVSNMPVNITLTEVHRQALESPVLKVATDLRDGKTSSLKQSAVNGDHSYTSITIKDAVYDHYKNHDQVLCGRNKTRSALNSKMRARLLASGEVKDTDQGPTGLSVGDRIVFLRNDYDENIFNGECATISDLLASEDDDLTLMSGRISYDENKEFEAYEVWTGITEGKDASEAPRFTQLVDLAYALTVHKSQGSEWDSVLVHYEPMGHGQDWLRWLYTGITRARLKCTLVMP